MEKIKLVPIEWFEENGRKSFKELEDKSYYLDCDLALLAVGFTTPEHPVLKQFNIALNERGLVKSENYKTNRTKIFAAGDARRGQSLVVWAISEGREAAFEVDKYLMGQSKLEQKGSSMTKVSK